MPGKSYRGLTGIMTPAISDSRCYGITDTLVVQSDKFIVLTLDKADTLYFSYNNYVTLQSVVHYLPKYISKDFRNVYFHIDSLNCLHNRPHFFT